MIKIKINTGYISSIRTCNSTREKKTIFYRLQTKISSTVYLSFIVPIMHAEFAICIVREIPCLKKLHELVSSVDMLRFLQSLLKKTFVLRAKESTAVTFSRAANQQSMERASNPMFASDRS